MPGSLIQETDILTLSEICLRCDISEAAIQIYVTEGLIDVAGEKSGQWLFSETSVVKVQKAQRLERDLDLNPAGAVLALDLMKQISDLKNRLRLFERESEDGW